MCWSAVGTCRWVRAARCAAGLGLAPAGCFVCRFKAKQMFSSLPTCTPCPHASLLPALFEGAQSGLVPLLCADMCCRPALSLSLSPPLQRPMNHGYALADWSADLAAAGVAAEDGADGQLPECSHAAGEWRCGSGCGLGGCVSFLRKVSVYQQTCSASQVRRFRYWHSHVNVLSLTAASSPLALLSSRSAVLCRGGKRAGGGRRRPPQPYPKQLRPPSVRCHRPSLQRRQRPQQCRHVAGRRGTWQ